MAEKKYAKHFMKDCVIDIKATDTPVFSFHGEKVGGVPMSCFWSVIKVPTLMEKVPMTHKYDQFLCFLGGDTMNIREFGAVVELYMGKETELNIIDSPTIVYIPAGMLHAPLNFKTINKPIMYLDIYLAPAYEKRLITQ